MLLIRHMVFSIEFKNGKNCYTALDADQAEDYALDLKYFHKESENLYICPILVATEAPFYLGNNTDKCGDDGVISLQRANKENLVDRVKAVSDVYGKDDPFDFDKWFNSPYYPTPGIVSAAVDAYRKHTVEDIARSEAGQEAIDKCVATLSDIIEEAKRERKKTICFVTGVPGAGKTLVGLDLASKSLSKGMGNGAVYLSGNGPLVTVLRAAIAKNIREAEKKSEREAKSLARTFIQGIHEFRRDTLENPAPPFEHIVIFDEAQRCWDEEHLSNWSKRKTNRVLEMSEPAYLVGAMDRHKDWAVIVCLVGLGQDIYNGEVGLKEWFRTICEDYQDWNLYYSPDIFAQSEDGGVDRSIISSSNVHEDNALHLNTSLRSFRSDKLSKFVDALLDLKQEEAKSLYADLIDKYPLYVTRDINKAKDWVRSKVRGSERSGLVACSSAQRLKPYGIFVLTDIDVENYFLAPKDDLRSSCFLEVVASEFKIQGLEIDWGIVAWDADLRMNGRGQWEHYSFKGTKWQKRNKEEQKRYLINSYRVLLTRARQGMVIFVPEGVDENVDKTRNHEWYDEIYDYLLSYGVKELPN